MCRHLAYLGPPIALDALLLEPELSLLEQAKAPRHQTVGTCNPHGFGVAWYPEHGAAPERYRTPTPMWEDRRFPALAAKTRATAVLAAVRLASPGSPVEATGNAPFVAGPWSFSLNGIAHDFYAGVGDELRALLSPRRSAVIEGRTDAEVLFALALDQLDRGWSPGAALVHVVRTVTARTTGNLNMLLTDGRRVAATRWGANSLFWLPDTIVASEPLDRRQGWEPIDDLTVLEIAGARTSVGSIPPV